MPRHRVGQSGRLIVLRRVLGVAVAVAFLAAAALYVHRASSAAQVEQFRTADRGTTSMVQTSGTGSTSTLPVGTVCAPAGKPLTIRSVRPFGVTGDLRVTGVQVGNGGPPQDLPTRIEAVCDVENAAQVSIELARSGGESAHADGVVITYDVDGRSERIRLQRPITLCLDLSEC